EIITKSAVELKQNNPKRKFNQLTTKISGKADEGTPSVTLLYENISKQLNSISIKQSELQDITDKVTLSAKIEIDNKVRKRLEEANKLITDGREDPTVQQDVQNII